MPMQRALLATKVRIPDRPHGLVPRPRLSQALERGISQSGHRLTVVSAPAGYGKSTLLAEWARSTDTPVAWLTLSAEDDERDRFLRYLLAAWKKIQPDVRDSPLGILLGSVGPDPESVLPELINLAAGQSKPQAFVLDDFHVIQDQEIIKSLTYLLDNLPPQLHFVLGTRAEPALPLARYRARGQLHELVAADLRFSREEATELIGQRMPGRAPPPEAVEAWQAQLEGWAAGLQLVALSQRGHRPDAPDTPTLSGRQRHIADYLSQDVLGQLPIEQREFLLRTSLLERLCAPLCEAVTAAPNAQSMLEQLERQNLFVESLDETRTWFRYHPLFADFLLGELERGFAAEISELHRRAARWHLQEDLPEPAFHHALAGDDPEGVVAIFASHFNAKLNAGELKVVERWTTAVPAAWYAAYPVLSLLRAGLLAYTGAFEACVRLVDETEQRLAGADDESARSQMARVMAVRCFIACAINDLPQAQGYADQALRDLPADDIGFRPAIFGTLGDAYRRNGRWEEARENYLQALAFNHIPAVRLQAAHVFGALADLELRRGRLQRADAYWEQALAAIQAPENWGRLPMPVIGWVYIRMGELLYERNKLAEAWAQVTRGLEYAEIGGDVRARFAGYLCAARLKIAEQAFEAATGYLERARPLVEQAEFAEWSSQFARLQLEIWLAHDHVSAAVSWSKQWLHDHANEFPPETEPVQLAIARVLLVDGDAPALERARELLERLHASAEAESRLDIETLALQAWARWQTGDAPGALLVLERALHLAQPDGYVRTFVDLGPAMARLLQEARSRKVMPDYIRTLLAGFAAPAEAVSGRTSGLPEPLTERELQVLRLIAAGLTNREIADQLVISVETVKKHSGNIFGKLGAGNRTEAVARARDLALLD
jgi:LuxR family transcriptional regulator, maltose regulon positive regulatory protein